MNKLLIIILLILIVIYIKYYVKYNKETTIIQTNINNINFNILNEKNPIYIEDKIVNINQIINSTFKYLFTLKFTNSPKASFAGAPSVHAEGVSGDENLKKNLSKFCLFHNNTEQDTDITIINPVNTKEFKFDRKLSNIKYLTSINQDIENIDNVKIILKPYNILIIPYGWLFKCSSQINNIFLYDLINIFIAKYKNLIH